MRRIFIAISFLLMGLLPPHIEAAVISFDIQPELVGVGQEILIHVLLDTEGMKTNAYEGVLQFPSEQIVVKDVSDGDSIVGYWIEKPNIVSSSVHFAGITTGGFEGTSGVLFSVIAETTNTGLIQASFQDLSILLHDGLGTPASITTNIQPIEVVGGISPLKVVYDDDSTAPESFDIKLDHDSNIFNDSWFIAFGTQDKNIGMSYYEIREVSSNDWAYFIGGGWTRMESPYLLKDQSLKSHIYVKAVDRNGNQRIAYLPPNNPIEWYQNYLVLMMIGILLAIGFVLSFRYSRK